MWPQSFLPLHHPQSPTFFPIPKHNSHTTLPTESGFHFTKTSLEKQNFSKLTSQSFLVDSVVHLPLYNVTASHSPKTSLERPSVTNNSSGSNAELHPNQYIDFSTHGDTFQKKNINKSLTYYMDSI